MSEKFIHYCDRFRDKADVMPVPIPVDAPPCPDCFFWRPVTNPLSVSKKDGAVRLFYEGVTLCHSNNMDGDFSCFRSRDAVERV